MTHFRNFLSALLFSLSGSVAIADGEASDPQACISAPTSDCVLDLAFVAAETEAKNFAWMVSILHVAFAQERLGMEKSDETLQHFFDTVEQREPNVDQLLNQIRFGYEFSKYAPKGSARVAEYLLELEPRIAAIDQSRLRRNIVHFLSSSQQFDRAFEIVRAAESFDDKMTLIIALSENLIKFGDASDLATFNELVSTRRELDLLSQHLVRMRLDEDSFGEAERIAGLITSEKDRAIAYSLIGMSYAQEGSVDDARRMLAMTGDISMYRTTGELGANVAEIYASIGDAQSYSAIVAEQDRVGDLARTIYIVDPEKGIARAKMIAGDLDAGFSYLATKHDNPVSYSVALRRVAETYFQLGNRDIAPFLENMPSAYSNRGLGILGGLQAKYGDLEGAQETFAQYRVAEPVYASVFDGASFELEKLLVARGQPSDAVAFAFERQDASALVYLAELID